MDNKANLDRTIPLEAGADDQAIGKYFGGREVKVRDNRVFDTRTDGEVLGQIKTAGERRELELTPRGRELVDREAAGWM